MWEETPACVRDRDLLVIPGDPRGLLVADWLLCQSDTPTLFSMCYLHTRNIHHMGQQVKGVQIQQRNVCSVTCLMVSLKPVISHNASASSTVKM